MKSLMLYVLLFALVFLATYSFAPYLGLDGPPASDQIIQTPFQDYRGLIRV